MGSILSVFTMWSVVTVDCTPSFKRAKLSVSSERGEADVLIVVPWNELEYIRKQAEQESNLHAVRKNIIKNLKDWKTAQLKRVDRKNFNSDCILIWLCYSPPDSKTHKTCYYKYQEYV